MRKARFIPFAALVMAWTVLGAQIKPGLLWKDDQGHDIHAHGGNIIKVGATFYWYGENTRDLAVPGMEYGAFNGVRCYSSTDFQTWHSEGIVCAPTSSGALSKHLIAYRPKVLHNSATSKYVMILSECCGDATGGVLNTGHLVYALSTTPTGPFVYQKTENPANRNVMDMTVFTDDDGTGYVIYSDGNDGITIDRLSSDYLSVAQRVVHIPSTGMGNCEEGPSMVKVNGRYFLTNSWCSYWNPNQNHYRSAPGISGPWSDNQDGTLGNTDTYKSQGGYILTITGSSGSTRIYMGDRWDCPQNACDLSMSKYVWLPLSFSGSTMSMSWYDTWYLDVQKGTWSAQPTGIDRGNDRLRAATAHENIAAGRSFDIRGKRLAGKCARGIRIISDGWRNLPAME